MNYEFLLAWILDAPMLAFFLLGIWGRRYFEKWSGILASCLLLISTCLSILLAYHYFFVEGRVDGAYPTLVLFKRAWLVFSPQLSIDTGVLLDPIAVMMLVVINFVSLMVHLFSLGYMKGEQRYATYFAFLSLFTFSMLGLVTSINFFQLYFFWELVGISSYLLIGFYYDKPSAVAASKKAFIVTRFADLGLLLGILILAFQGHTLDFHTLITRLTTSQSPEWIAVTGSTFLGFSALTWGLLLVFIGGAGKSAMFPLHIWLPDAMEGPTPVSALIHAATMVVAGVYLVARLFPIFLLDPAIMHLIAYVGIASAFLAAICACAQSDIKRILAFSTISQIGFMMLALGVSGFTGEEGLGFSASMFHLFTHAFFKSLLFLCAGAIIHEVHSNDLRDMGGLARTLPFTHICFLVGCLAIAGIPFFSGYFSKEDVLLAAFRKNLFIYGLALLTSGLTSFYMFRLYFSIFFRTPAKQFSDEDIHVGKLPLSMRYPLLILSLCAALAGLVPFSHFVTADGSPLLSTTHWLFSVFPVCLSLIAILIAASLYFRKSDRPAAWVRFFGSFYQVVTKKFYFDELYLFVTKKIIFNLVGRPAAWFDKQIVDGFMNGLAKVTASFSSRIKGLQSGSLQDYTWYFLAGIAGLSVLFIYVWR